LDLQALNPFDLPEPFLRQSSAGYSGETHRFIVPRERLETLGQMGAPPLAGLIFHVGRCGSTLVSQTLKLGAPVLSEPDALANLLAPPWGDWTRQELGWATSWLLGLFAESAPGQVVVKLTSWHVLFHDILLAAAPGARTAFVYRHPLDVARSILREPPPWATQWIERGDSAVTDEARAETLARLVGSLLLAGQGQMSVHHAAVDYADLRPDGLERLLAHFEVEASSGDLAAVMRRDAKADGPVDFQPRAAKPADDPLLQAAIATHALPAYDALQSR
jgi:hypothetical protein